MNRDKILALIDPARGRGLEIGALARPAVTRDLGPVEYVDRGTTAELRHAYRNDVHVTLGDLVEVDHAWGDQALADCVGGTGGHDYVVASHVIEHVPDVLGWLVEIAAVLRAGGVLSLVIPDKRYTFDVLRRTSSEAELVDAYVRRLRRPGARQLFDHFFGARDLAAEPIASGRVLPSDPSLEPDAANLLELCRITEAQGDYVDCHCWVFTPQSFLAALDLGSRLDLLPFEVAAFAGTEPGTDEFHISLRRLADDLTPQARRARFLESRARFAPAPTPQPNVEELALRARTAQAELDALRRSASWRITAPLRRLASLVRR